MLSRSLGQVAYVLRDRSPLGLLPARLAFLRHVASVRPEPGSNSPSRSRHRRTGAFDRRVAPFDDTVVVWGNIAPPAEADRRGIDMSLRRLISQDRRPHWLLAFTALFSRSGSPTGAPHDRSQRACRCRSDTHPIRGRERPGDSSVGVNRLHRSGPRASVVYRHAGRLTRLHAGAAPVKQAQHPPQGLVGAGDEDYPTVTRAHFRRPNCNTWVPSGTTP